jgi:hypothetical protein
MTDRDKVEELLRQCWEAEQEGGPPDTLRFDPVFAMVLAKKALATETRPEQREVLQGIVDGEIPLAVFVQTCVDAMVEDIDATE